ncbi:GDSL-type esterase/lipase family protein, partial [Escherichia coli]
MTIYGTNKPLGSTDPKDLFDNSQNFDTAINSITDAIWHDRFGRTRRTWYGLEGIASAAINKFIEDGKKAIAGVGYITMDSFQDGKTLTLTNQALRWKLPDGDGDYYRWDGALPKVVPPGSTPTTSGGVDKGKWVNVSDGTARSDLAKPTGATMVGTPFDRTLGEILASDPAPMSFGYATEAAKNKLCRHGAKVVLVGDSLSSFYNIDTANITSLFESYLRRKVQEINPTAEFINRAIGGMRYYDLGRNEPVFSTPNSGYPWYDNTSKRWMSYIDDLKPDVVILAFGMNDGAGWLAGNFQQPNFYKMMDELRTISSEPEIIFCTNILPSKGNPATSDFDQQSGRDAMAGWTRSYAKFIGASFIDLHRRFKALRDGVDPCAFSYARKTTSVLVNLPYSYTDMVPCYSARLVLTDPAVMTVGIHFSLSQATNNFVTLAYDMALSKWHVKIYTGTSVGITINQLADGAAPSVGMEILFSLNGDALTIFIG